MNDHLKQNLKNILEGKATMEEARRFLSDMDGDPCQDVFSDEKFSHLLNTYNERNGLKYDAVPSVTENEKNKIWENLLLKHQQKSVFSQYAGNIKNAVKTFFTFENFFSIQKTGYALAFLLLVFVTPLVFQLSDFNRPSVQGMKGDNPLNPQATVSFAIVDKTPTLIRPDRILAENDTIAFRINLEADRYCSLYVVFDDQIDQIISNKFFTKGPHVLDLGYRLAGNSGENRILLLNSEQPMMVPEGDKQKLLREIIKNNISSLTIKQNLIGIDSKTFNVN